MRPFHVLRWLAAAAPACSEYDLKGEEPVPDVPGDTGEPVVETGDTAPPEEDCPDQVLSGYAGSSDEACELELEVGVFDPVVEWEWTASAEFPGYHQVMATPAAGPLDGDDIPEIVFTAFPGTSWNGAGTLVALHGDGSGTLWELDRASGERVMGCGAPALGDLDGDGSAEVCTAGVDHAVVCLDWSGALVWAAGSETSVYGGPAIADLDADGSPEVVFGRQVFDADGNLIGLGGYGVGGQSAWWASSQVALSFPVDMDGDGELEVVAGNAVYEADGSLVWTDGGADGFPAVADFDADGSPEVVKVTGGVVTLRHADGSIEWTAPTGAGGNGGPPTVADFDGDGEPEIGVAGSSYYVVLDTDGTTLWSFAVSDYSSHMTGSSVFDFEGDGGAEVVYADEHTVWVFDGATGTAEMGETGHASATAFEYPIIADVDGDGATEIVVGSNNGYYSGWNGIRVIGSETSSWRPSRPVWNQHAYHITNVEDDLSIPAAQDRNWLTYNNFRSGDLRPSTGTLAPDLTLARGDECEIDCDDGRLVVWVHPGNTGAADASAGAIASLYAVVGGVESVIETRSIADPIAMGTFGESLQFEVADPRTLDGLVARIAGTDVECDESDNELEIAGPFCE